MNFETTVERGTDEENNPMIPQAIAFFHTMLDTIANATQLAKDVKELSLEVSKLRNEVEEVHLRNMDLTNTINTVRAERDDFAGKYAQSQGELAQEKAEAEYQRNRANGLDTTLAAMLDSHAKEVADIQAWHAGELAAVTTQRDSLKEAHWNVALERDSLARELSETKDRFQAVEKRLREIVGSLPQQPQQVAAPEPQVEQEPWRSASGY